MIRGDRMGDPPRKHIPHHVPLSDCLTMCQFVLHIKESGLMAFLSSCVKALGHLSLYELPETPAEAGGIFSRLKKVFA